MPSKDSKVVSARIPNDIEFGVSISKILSSVYAAFKAGKIGIDKNGIVIKEDHDNSQGVNPFSEPESDPDGEWVRDMAHDLNVDVRTFKRKIEQSVNR